MKANGASVQKIADELSVSPKMVYKYLPVGER